MRQGFLVLEIGVSTLELHGPDEEDLNVPFATYEAARHFCAAQPYEEGVWYLPMTALQPS